MWIKLHKSITEWEWFTKPEMLQVFIFLLTKANYKDNLWQGKLIRRGQLVTTVDDIRIHTKLTPQKIRTCLKRLQSTNEISQKSTNRFTLITICNYDRYQVEETTEQQTTNKQITNNQQTTNKPIYTEEKEYNNIYHSITCARARDSLEQCLDELLADRSWLEAVLYNVRSLGYKQVFELDEYLKLFFSKLKAEGETFKELSDAKHHFSNWITIYLKNETNRTTYQVSRKQEANDYILNKFVTNYSTVDDEVQKPF